MAERRLRYSPHGILQPSIDGRSREARRFRRLCEEFAREIGGNLTASDRAAIAQAVSFQMEEERLRAEMASGADVDHDTFVRVSSEARRARAAIKSKGETYKPDAQTELGQYLADKYGRAAAEPEDEAVS
jgi:hypothetical protein